MLHEGIQEIAPGTEGGRRPTGVPGGDTVELAVPKKRRKLTVAYKIWVVETIRSLKTEGDGSIGGFLRKEGLYHSLVQKWMPLYDSGELSRRLHATKGKTKALEVENQRLRREHRSLERRLEKAEAIIEIQKKLSAFLGLNPTAPNENNDEP
jgi:transposase